MGRRSFTPLILTALMLMMSWGALIDAVEETNNEVTIQSLETTDVVMGAPSPGHVVFAEYVGGQNCPPCYNGGTASLTQLKNSNTDEFVYITYMAAQYQVLRTAQAGEVSPINRISHLDGSGSNSAPRAYFGECPHNAQSTSCYQSGAGGTNTYDDFFSGAAGKSNNMHSTVNDYSMTVTQSPVGNDVDITVSATYHGTGTKDVSVFAAVTEYVCHSYPYQDGSKSHNCFKQWLTNSTNDGFVHMTLSSTPSTYSWTVPKSTVYNSDVNNMLTVAALQSGWSTGSTRYDVLSATDSHMNPMDLSVTDFTWVNTDAQSLGFQTGDLLQLEATIGNTGTEDYSDGGSIQLYQILSSGQEQAIGTSTPLNNLNVGQTQTVSVQFDTSGISMNPNDPQTPFRVRLSNTQGEKDPVGNNMRDVYALHDMIPSTTKPIATGTTAIPRGATLDFEVTGMSNDNVDDLTTMAAKLETSPAGANQWMSDWVSGGSLMGAGTANERFVFTISPPNSAGSGAYDVRARLTDARGQIGDWSTVNSDAFNLQNGLPMVITSDNLNEAPSNCPSYPGQPTVKVETIETISVAGLICDAETPLDQLVVSSNNPAFRAWNPSTGEIEVRFDSVAKNTQGEVITQPLQVTMNDGEDGNSGTLNIMVIENGAPRWSSLPTKAFDEGGSSSIILTPYLSDTDASGNGANPSALSLSIEYISNNSLITSELNGQTLNIDGANDDAFGTAMITIRATDADGQSSETELTVIVANVNDAPTLDVSSFENMILKVDEEFNFDIAGNLMDVDDVTDPLYVQVSCDTWKTGSRYNPLDGAITAWFEEEGTHTMTIIVSDVHDASNVYDVTIQVVDNLPIEWSESVEVGDLKIQAEDLFVGELPSFSITQHSDLVLSDIKVEWTICNIETGICSDFGEGNPTSFGEPYNFTVTKDGGVLYRDQIKVIVYGVDSNGYDRVTDASKAYDITLERPADVDDSSDDSATDGASTDVASGPPLALIGIGAALVVGLIIALVLGVMLMRGGKDEELGMGYGAAPPQGLPPAPMGAAPMAAPPAPAPQMLSDYTQLPPGGNYVTNEMGQTVYLSPDNSDWTMQPDNSFVRTR